MKAYTVLTVVIEYVNILMLSKVYMNVSTKSFAVNGDNNEEQSGRDRVLLETGSIRGGPVGKRSLLQNGHQRGLKMFQTGP